MQYRSLCLIRIVVCWSGDAGSAAMAGIAAGLPAGIRLSDPISRFRCRACGKQFNERSGTLLNRTQYPSDVIALVVLWRLRYKLSLRDLPEMFAMRGIVFSYEAVREWEAKLTPALAEDLRRRRRGTVGRSWYVDETSYEDCCVKSVLFSAGRHRLSSACWHSPGAEVELCAARGCPRQPRIRRDSVPATIPCSGRRSSEASGATLHQRRCQAAHVSSRPPLPRPHRTSSARRFWPDPSIRVRRCSAGLSPSRRATVSVARSGRLQLHPLRHGAALNVSPERDQELSRQGDDHDLAQAAPRAAQAIVEPA